MIYAIECNDIYIPIFMKIDISIESILRFRFRNLRSCNVGITGGRDS
jgi:hypothetical protein